MINANYDTNMIENELWQAMRAASACPMVYANRRPSSVTKNADTFIVVRSVTEISDKTAFGNTICRIEIYVKEVGGVKNSTKASAITQLVMDALPVETSKYLFTYLSGMSLGLDNTGYDVEAVNINVLIKK